MKHLELVGEVFDHIRKRPASAKGRWHLVYDANGFHCVPSENYNGQQRSLISFRSMEAHCGFSSSQWAELKVALKEEMEKLEL